MFFVWFLQCLTLIVCLSVCVGAAALLGETLSSLQWMGALLILLSTFAMSRLEHESAHGNTTGGSAGGKEAAAGDERDREEKP